MEMNFNMTTKANKKFDIDLKYGQIREDQISAMFKDKKIEVKTERDWWYKTGNIALEYECNNKPSGINATQSDYWIQILAKGDDNHCMLVFEVSKLKEIVNKYKEKYTRMVGDRHASKCVILPIKKLFEKEAIGIE
jgi:hypothetical protein|tara:strand:- start:85 stop:492 length:408 start_codon:yes stop_codon:yes gene_type:complete